MTRQAGVVKRLGDYVCELKRVGKGHGGEAWAWAARLAADGWAAAGAVGRARVCSRPRLRRRDAPGSLLLPPTRSPHHHQPPQSSTSTSASTRAA